MNRGFTLIELLVTLALVVLLSTLAVPGFNSMISTNRLAADYNEILASLHYARSEAAKRRKDVTADVSSDASGAWIVSVTYQPDASSAVETLKVREARDGRVSLSGLNEVVFNSLGRRESCSADPCTLSVQLGGDSHSLEVYPTGNIN
ncbi:GspH/FimT family pseudopilin [Halomonas koreensis]|uniref:Type II secretion system protein H n=1 Tax=Halomonas koreensis TaxID=245385 RepID=A0ABU1G4R3_9GAMM|nr:GspH/FimT family pseudopilin [Halomonas koreensis]MDR5867890.1 GspH/FimT family pseudopilin [Halomonas koreensis]